MENIATSLEIKVWKCLKRHANLLTNNAAVVVAVSGGPDSVALAHLLDSLIKRHKLSATLHIAHFDHAQRGEESTKDADFVKEMAGKLGLPYHYDRLSEFAMRKGRGIEDNLRRARFGFLMNIAFQTGAKVIFVGHNYNDNIETVLMRLMRGSNLHGIAGIRSHRTISVELSGRKTQLLVVRPMLEIKRTEIISYLDSQKIKYRIDSSNNDNRFKRNWVRNVLLDQIRTNFNPGIDGVLHRFCEQMRNTENYINRVASREFTQVVTVKEEKWLSIRIPELRERHPAIALEILSRALSSMHIAGVNDYRHIRAVYSLLFSKKTDSFSPLPDSHLAVRDGDQLHFVSKARWEAYQKSLAAKKVEADSEYIIPVPGQVIIPNVGVIRTQILPFYDDFMASFVEQKTNLEEFVDADKLSLPLVFRYPNEDDRFQPLGFSRERRLSSFLRDARVPLHQRDKMAVIADAEKIIWVVKIRVSEAAKFEEGGVTKKIVRISIKEI